MLAVAVLLGSIARIAASIIIIATVAAQAATFRTLVDVGYNSAFTIENLMNALTAAHAAIAQRDHAQAVHGRLMTSVIACYAAGAIVGAAGARKFGRAGS